MMSGSDNPYELLSTKEIYKNPWLSVREDTVKRPEGKNGIFGVLTVNDGVSILPMDNEGNVYLIKEYQYAAGKSTLLTISGGIDEGEEPLQAARRELKEESGLTANEWIDLGTIESMTMIVDCMMHLYLARDLHIGEADVYDQHTITLKKIPFTEAVQLVMNSKIAPAAGNVLILRADNYLRAK